MRRLYWLHPSIERKIHCRFALFAISFGEYSVSLLLYKQAYHSIIRPKLLTDVANLQNKTPLRLAIRSSSDMLAVARAS